MQDEERLVPNLNGIISALPYLTMGNRSSTISLCISPVDT
jgi:hypothetical protein